MDKKHVNQKEPEHPTKPNEKDHEEYRMEFRRDVIDAVRARLEEDHATFEEVADEQGLPAELLEQWWQEAQENEPQDAQPHDDETLSAGKGYRNLGPMILVVSIDEVRIGSETLAGLNEVLDEER
jgi:transposase-like protein